MKKEKFIGIRIDPDDLPEPDIIWIPDLIGGINTSKSPGLINPNESPYCKNIEIENLKNIAPRKGYVKMSDTPLYDSGGNASKPKHICEFKQIGLDSKLVALNDDYLYYWDTVLEDWVYGEDCVAAAVFTGSGLDDLTAGDTFNGVGTVSYRVQIDSEGTPDTFKWSNDGGSTWEVENVEITGSVQELDNGVFITFLATTGHTDGDRWDFDAEQPAAHFTGGSDDYFSTAVCSDVLCIANGVDKIMGWDGSTAPAAISADAPIAKYLIQFADRLFASGVADYPQRIQWCVSGDITDWTGTGSGYKDMIETADAMTGFGLLSGNLIIFREESTLVGVKTGIPEPCVAVKLQYPKIGCWFPRSIIQVENEIFFVNREPALYSISNSGIKRKSDKIDTFFRNQMDLSDRSMPFANYNPIYSAYWFNCPTVGSSSNDQVFCYRPEGDFWTYHSLGFTCGSLYEWQGAGYTFDNQPDGTFDTDTGNFDDIEGGQSQPIAVFGDSSGYIHKMTGGEIDDDGSSFECIWESFDMTDPKGRLLGGLKLILDYYSAADFDMNVWMSVDGGVLYNFMDSLDFVGSAGIQIAHADFMAAGSRIRFRLDFTAGSETWEILSIKPKLIVRGDHFPIE